jgi:hypothetical protein
MTCLGYVVSWNQYYSNPSWTASLSHRVNINCASHVCVIIYLLIYNSMVILPKNLTLKLCLKSTVFLDMILCGPVEDH